MHFKVKICFSIEFLNVNVHCNSKTTSKQNNAFYIKMRFQNSKTIHFKAKLCFSKCTFKASTYKNTRCKAKMCISMLNNTKFNTKILMLPDDHHPVI